MAAVVVRGATSNKAAILAECHAVLFFFPSPSQPLLAAAPSDCVYLAEGRFASRSLGMNGELISPGETSQSLHIYSPPPQ